MIRYDHLTLDNGLNIVGEHNDGAQSMAAGYFVRTGARDETAGISGCSHFLEHMMFKGSAHRTADDVNREFDEIGAQYNAFTSEENTVYYGSVLPEYQRRVVDLLTDMMRPALRTDDFDVEKNVILEEIALYKDRPQFTVMDDARAAFYAGHPLGNSVLGTTESIQALQRDQMHDYFIAPLLAQQHVARPHRRLRVGRRRVARAPRHLALEAGGGAPEAGHAGASSRREGGAERQVQPRSSLPGGAGYLRAGPRAVRGGCGRRGDRRGGGLAAVLGAGRSGPGGYGAPLPLRGGRRGRLLRLSLLRAGAGAGGAGPDSRRAAHRRGRRR